MYQELIETVAKHATGRGASVDLKYGTALSELDITRVTSKSVIPIPDTLLALYREVGDGLWFLWRRDKTCGKIELPPLADVVVHSMDDLTWRIEWSEGYDYRYTRDPSLAKQTARHMRQWLRFHDEGNGDCFAIDTGNANLPVVFDKHDWMDGGDGFNGWVLGESIPDFFRNWSRVCFQAPDTLWWPSVFNENRGVDWNSDRFSKDFRIE